MALQFTLNADGNIDFVDTRLNQPISQNGANGQIQQIAGITQDITLKYMMKPDDMKLEIINLSKRRADLVKQQTAQLTIIDARVADLNSALALIV